jgi:hypothetical protein
MAVHDIKHMSELDDLFVDEAPPDACKHPKLDFGPTIEVIKACVSEYIKTRKLWSLALANYALDYWCTSVLYECCGRQPLVARNTKDNTKGKGQGDDLIINVMQPQAVLKECSVFLTNVLEAFNQLHEAASPGEPVTVHDVKKYVEGTLCRYNQLGYGMYRFVSSAGGNIHVNVGSWSNWREYSICNCLVVSLLSGIIAQHYGLPEVITCRISPKDNDFLRRAQKAQSNLKGSSLQSILPYNHLEFFGKHKKGLRTHRSRAVDACHSIYNFVLMPLEWMIVDSLMRGVCKDDVTAPYAELLSSFREQLLSELEIIMPPKCTARFHKLTSKEAAQEREFRRATRKRVAGMNATVSFPDEDSDRSGESQSADSDID